MNELRIFDGQQRTGRRPGDAAAANLSLLTTALLLAACGGGGGGNDISAMASYSIQFSAIFISLLSLLLSGVTFWLTSMRKGRLICFRPKSIRIGINSDGELLICFRQLFLANDGARGRFIEGLFLSVTRNTKTQIFDAWVYGRSNEQRRASGAKVPVDGFISDHFFLLPVHVDDFRVQDGDYQLELNVRIWGKSAPQSILKIGITIQPDQTKMLNEPNDGLDFDWSEERQQYVAYITPNSKSGFDEVN